MNDKETHILLFDGVCNLCNSVVKFTIKRDHKKKFKFAALQSDKGIALLKQFGLAADDFDSFVLIKGDKYYLRSSAGIMVLRELGGIWKLANIFIYLPESIRDSVYNLIAKSRYGIFGKQDTCMMPKEEIKNRFL